VGDGCSIVSSGDVSSIGTAEAEGEGDEVSVVFSLVFAEQPESGIIKMHINIKAYFFIDILPPFIVIIMYLYL
jgi:hypothetical protein